MKLKFTLVMWTMASLLVSLQSQSVMELKEKKAEIETAQADLQAQVDAYQGEIDGINSELEVLGGWKKGLLGSIGLNFGSQSNWAASANPNSSNSSLNIGINAFANSIREDDFWRNKGVISLGWQSLDTDTKDGQDGDGFLTDPVTDILNINSLYGRKVSDKWAISAMGELNSSVASFLNPGSLDIGAGATWTPNSDLVVVFHPFNYHVAFSSVDGVSSTGALGGKIRADYTHTFPGGIGWSSTLTTFIPYASKEPTLFEYTWLNTLNYTLAGGIGLNIGFGLRNAEFESLDVQRYLNFGLSYSISK